MSPSDGRSVALTWRDMGILLASAKRELAEAQRRMGVYEREPEGNEFYIGLNRETVADLEHAIAALERTAPHA